MTLQGKIMFWPGSQYLHKHKGAKYELLGKFGQAQQMTHVKPWYTRS